MAVTLLIIVLENQNQDQSESLNARFIFQNFWGHGLGGRLWPQRPLGYNFLGLNESQGFNFHLRPIYVLKMASEAVRDLGGCDLGGCDLKNFEK